MARRTAVVYHDSLQKSYGSQARNLRLLLRGLFSVAGVMWILAYVFPFTTQEELWQFRMHQYQLYMMLLTVWGYQAKRDYRRLHIVSDIATERGIGLQSVDADMISAAQHLDAFDVLLRHTRDGSWFPVIFSWFLFALSIVLILLQLRLLFVD